MNAEKALYAAPAERTAASNIMTCSHFTLDRHKTDFSHFYKPPVLSADTPRQVRTTLRDYCGGVGDKGSVPCLCYPGRMAEARFFPDARLNFTEWSNRRGVMRLAALRLDKAILQKTNAQIRNGATPCRVSAKFIPALDIPRARSGKITEIAVRDSTWQGPKKQGSARKPRSS